MEKLRGEGVNIYDGAASLWNNCYFWDSDEIWLYPKAHISTLFHEMAHWTGNSGRLDRGSRFNLQDPQAVMKEELIAWESTQTIGIRLEFELDDENAGYFTKWTKKYLGPYPKDDAFAASSFLIDRFEL